MGEDVEDFTSDKTKVVSEKLENEPLAELKQFLLQLDNNINENLIQSIWGHNNLLIKTIHKRMHSIENETTEGFMTGIYNHPLHPNFISIFQGLYNSTISYGDLQNNGQQIYNSRLQLAKNHVLKNAVKVKLSDGKNAAVVESPFFINIIHSELKNMFNTDLSIAINLDLHNEKLRYSVRRNNENLDCIEVINRLQKVGGSGGGSINGTGGSIPHKIPIPF